MRRIFTIMLFMLGLGRLGDCASFETFEFKLDTAMYEQPNLNRILIYPGPEYAHYSYHFISEPADNQILLQLMLFHKKNSDQYDIFSFSGKVGSLIIPSTLLPEEHINSIQILCSRTFIDEDDGWECIINDPYETGREKFYLVDNDGTQILSGTGKVAYGFDGKNTYVFQRDVSSSFNYKVWRFRTNITSASQPALTKSVASGPLPMMTFGAAGDYRISFEPSGGGRTTVQLFDMLGKQVFMKTIDDITRPVSFTIPESDMPRTPFIAKVRDGKGSTVRREIPVR